MSVDYIEALRNSYRKKTGSHVFNESKPMYEIEAIEYSFEVPLRLPGALKDQEGYIIIDEKHPIYPGQMRPYSHNGDYLDYQSTHDIKVVGEVQWSIFTTHLIRK